VLDHLVIDTYATFGYSMDGVMAGRLAMASLRVTAVACGGFPLTADLTADLTGMGQRARARDVAARNDPAAWREILTTYDPLAAEVFCDDIADCREPRWQTSAARGIPYEVVPVLDHDGMLERIDLVWPSVAEWLADG
jgi:pimeloyl-ACP methyl ester carboxylesterase